jgi:hypothetical protein
MKRTTQLTGLCFPDAALKSTNTVQSLLSHLIKPPKPRKLKEALQQKEELVKLPNRSTRRSKLADGRLSRKNSKSEDCQSPGVEGRLVYVLLVVLWKHTESLGFTEYGTGECTIIS